MNKRYYLLDAVRGLALLNMLAYHFCYDLRSLFGLPLGFMETRGAFWWQQAICWSFILVSGAAARLSHRLARRGTIVLAAGLLLTVVTLLVLPSERILFGVLHLLGCAMLLTALLERFLRRVPPLAGAVASAFLFGATRWLSQGRLLGVEIFDPGTVTTNLLAPLGVFAPGFFSSDYFPILPWLFLFLTGYFLLGLSLERGWNRALTQRVPVLSAIGRRTLPVYLLHQPILMGICWLLFVGL